MTQKFLYMFKMLSLSPIINQPKKLFWYRGHVSKNVAGFVD